MSPATQKIEREISQLPVQDQFVLHERLIARIHDQADNQELDPAFQSEIARRVNDIKTGKVRSVDAFRALKKM